MTLINILKILKDRQNKIALLGVLRSPICLAKDEVLVNLSKENKLNIYADVKDEKVQNTYIKLRALQGKLSFLNPIELVNEILETFNFTACQALASSNEQVLANITKFKQVVAELFENGSYTLEILLDNFDTYQKEINEESSAVLAEENFNVVKILTIHKAKGLEFPVVILTDMSKQIGRSDPREKGKSKAMYSRNLNLKGLTLGDIKDGALPLIEREKQAREEEEKRRLLYVAMTRAKEALIIVDSLKVKDKTFAKFLKDSACWPNEEGTQETVQTAKVFYYNYDMPEFALNKYKTEEDKNFTFKVNTRRADKTYPYTSVDVNMAVGEAILDAFPQTSVDVHEPDVMLNIELRPYDINFYSEIIPGPGGMPTGSAGKAMLLLSGGIDSPVAGYMAAKRGAKTLVLEKNGRLGGMGVSALVSPFSFCTVSPVIVANGILGTIVSCDVGNFEVERQTEGVPDIVYCIHALLQLTCNDDVVAVG